MTTESGNMMDYLEDQRNGKVDIVEKLVDYVKPNGEETELDIYNRISKDCKVIGNFMTWLRENGYPVLMKGDSDNLEGLILDDENINALMAMRFGLDVELLGKELQEHLKDSDSEDMVG